MLRQAISVLRGFLAPYPYVLPSVAVLGTVAALAEGVSIGLMIPFLATMIGDAPAGGGLVARAVGSYADLFAPEAQLVAVSASVIALVIVSCVISFGYIRLLSWAATQVSHDLRVRLFARFFEADEMFVAAGSQGRQIKAIDGAAHRAGQAVISLCLAIAAGCTALVFGVLLLLISWKLTALVIGGVALAGLVVRLYIKRSMALSRRFENRSTAVSDTTVQVLSSLRMVRIFGQEARETTRFTAESESVRHAEFRLESIRRAMTPLIDGMTVPILIAALVIAFFNGVSAAILLPFLVLVFRLQRYVREFDQSQVRIAADAGAILEVATLLRPPARARARVPGTRPVDAFARDIVFDRVSFTHAGLAEGRGPSLSDVSLKIARGETLGIVGASGSGKSTLINLLVGLQEPSEGEIRIDGVRLRDLDLASWRLRLGFSGQDADLRTGSIRENIAYGVPEAPCEAIRAAAAQARILEFIEKLPQGLDTPVGARGLQLSGGERQRIALARALLRRPDILILDEATNAVDNASEAAIRDTLVTLKGSITMIVIAHRLSSVQHADRIVVMEAGRIIETGTPAELLASEGAYARLARLDRAAR